MLVKFDIAHHAATGTGAIGHPPMSIPIQIKHNGVEVDLQEVAELCQCLLRCGNEIFKGEPMLALRWNVTQKGENMLVADELGRFGQGAPANRYCLWPGKLVNPCLLIRVNHAVWMPRKMHKPGIGEECF